MAYVKRMSDDDTEDYYEEMEWRLVYDESPDNKHFTQGEAKGIHRLRFRPSDVKAIVFPDKPTQLMALGNARMKGYFAQHMPIVATLDDCSSF